jgi:hypothetical protein
VHCPRCGTPNEPGDRYCGSCGAQLEKLATPTAKARSGGGGLSRLIGTTKSARIVSSATALAIVVAIAAFIALKPKDEGIPRDAYTIAADRLCMNAKRQIVAAGRQGGSAFARQLVAIVVNWRTRLGELHVPSDRREQVVHLDVALRAVEIDAASLARVAERHNRALILASARVADAASTHVEQSVAELGLSGCAGETIGFASPK